MADVPAAPAAQAARVAHVGYDTRSGRIISVHSGAVGPAQARERAVQHAGGADEPVAEEHVAVIAVPAGTIEPGRRYAVDPERHVLVETDGAHGAGFGFGATGRSGTRPTAPAPAGGSAG
jgi:hypothetical protein